MKLTLKKNLYNEKHETSSISVQRFIVCRNLIDNFNVTGGENVYFFILLVDYVDLEFVFFLATEF